MKVSLRAEKYLRRSRCPAAQQRVPAGFVLPCWLLTGQACRPDDFLLISDGKGMINDVALFFCLFLPP